MGRKAKCTVEKKIKAVKDYLNGIRSVADIMNDLAISSQRSIRNWIIAYEEQGSIALQPSPKNRSYSKEFKITMVEKYICGKSSVTDLCAKYGIKGHHTLQRWIYCIIAIWNLRIMIRNRRSIWLVQEEKQQSVNVRIS